MKKKMSSKKKLKIKAEPPHTPTPVRAARVRAQPVERVSRQKELLARMIQDPASLSARELAECQAMLGENA